MSTILNSRRVLFAAALLSLGAVSAARADVRFHNETDQPVHFSITCNGDEADTWTISPHGTKDLYCDNGSSAAMVEIRTDHGNHDEVVHATVWDGSAYVLGFDDDGDVNIWRM
jgi:hypothetical protein